MQSFHCVSSTSDRTMRSFFYLAFIIVSSVDAAPFEEFHIQLVTAGNADAVDAELLPLAGSWQHETARNETEKEDRKFFQQADLPEEVMSLLKDVDYLKKNLVRNKKELYRQLTDAAWAGAFEAQELVALQYLYGEYLQRNISGAKELFERLSAHGHPLGQMGQAFLYSTGLTHEKPNQPLALLHYTFAALGGNVFAQMALGYRYLYGINVEYNCEQALRFYRRAAARVVDHIPVTGGSTIQRLRLYDEWENPGVSNNVDEDLLHYYHHMSGRGDTQIQFSLGQMYLVGSRGIEQDRLKALKLFKKAAEGGSVNALAYLGKMYLEGSHEVPQNNQTAYNYFRKAADSGNALGQSGLGLMYLYGRGVDVDYKQALRHFKLASDQSSVEGQLHLGIMVYLGLGVDRDIQKAAKLFTQASQGGSVTALYFLGEINANGQGVPRSCRQSTEIFKQVAERGRWGQLFASAFSDYKRNDFDSALVKYMLLGDLGYEVGQSNVAFLLDMGSNSFFPTNESYQRAMVYWERSANQGYAIAKIKLGDYYYYGQGTDIDYEAAVKNYREAETSNNPQALFNLGYMYQLGLGVKQDLHLAKRYYDRAAELHTDAYVPVLLALISLGAMFIWQRLTNMAENTDPASLTPTEIYPWLLENWDLLLVTVLIGTLVIVVFLMNRLSSELTRQRQEMRRRAGVRNPAGPDAAPVPPAAAAGAA